MSLDDDRCDGDDDAWTTLPAHMLLDAIDRETRDMVRRGQAATRRRSYVEGSTLRGAANRLRRQLGLEPLTYDWTGEP